METEEAVPSEAEKGTEKGKDKSKAGSSQDKGKAGPSEAEKAEKVTAIQAIHAEAARIGPVHALDCDNKTGQYELFGIITHQGRTAEGGHYVAWVKRDEKTWLVFDDETVAEIDASRIKELYGGGDWHIAYMCLYRKMDTLTLDE